MTSGHRTSKDPTVASKNPSEPPPEWFEQAYATCSVASVVVDGQQRTVFVNEAAQKLLDLDSGDAPADVFLHSDESCDTLGDLIAEALDDQSALHTWKGRLDRATTQPLEIRFIPLPGPSRLLLCRFLTYRNVATEVRVQLISELADIHRHGEDFDDSVQRLVATIYDHLDAPTVAIWSDDEEYTDRWFAGDEQACQKMIDEFSHCSPPHSTTGVFGTGESVETVRIPIRLSDGLFVHLLIARNTTEHRLRDSAAFWNCLATTVQTSLRNARLLELNRQERHRLRAVLEHMPMAVVIFDRRGKVLDLNLRARAMTGRRSWPQLGDDNHPFDVCDAGGDVLPREQWPLLRALNTGEGCEEEEYILDFGDRQRTISISVIPITDNDEQITSFLATGRDVTRRSKEERRKDEFLSVASHELRGPLTPLAGFLHMSRQQAESDQPVDPEVLQKAHAQVHRLQRLIDGLLDVSRMETGRLPIQRREICLNDLIARVMNPWLDGPHGDRIQLSVPDETIDLHADPDRLDQVITNVVDNAIRHGRDDGRVRVSVRRSGDAVQLTVRDDGDGIPQAIIDRVFERFFCVDNQDSSSTGIGLYVSRQIVEDHGGTITIDSARGEPTTVSIFLPTDKP